MSESNPDIPPDTDNIESQTAGIYTNLILGSVITVVSLILFEILRRKVPAVFESRRVLHDRRDPSNYENNRIYYPASPSYRPFGWIHPILHLEIDTIARTHGLDTALFLRYLRTMVFLFFILLIPTVPLLPIYFTGTFNENRKRDEDVVLGVQKFSISNVTLDDSWRFWVSLAVDYVVVILVLLVLYREFSIFAKYRIDYRASKNPANYAIMVEDVPKSQVNDNAIYAYWNQLFPGCVRKVFVIRNAKKLDKKLDEFWKIVNKRETAEWNNVHNKKLKGERPKHKQGSGPSCCLGSSSLVDSINHWTDQQQKTAATIKNYQEHPDSSVAPVTRAAIVVFDTRRTAAIAAQTNFAVKEHEWRVIRAPEPKAINWTSFGIPGYQLGLRQFITITASMALTIFWVIPVTFIMSLTSLSSLAELEIAGEKPFSFLQKLIDWSPTVLSLIESVLPAIVLSVFLSLIPTFLRMFINISRVSSNATVDILVRDWYFNFVIFSNFLFVIVSGSLLTEISKIAAEPKRIASFLASSAPKQGAFLMNFIILKAVSETPKEILQLGRVIVRWVMLKFLAKTERQKKNASVGNTQFAFFRYYAIAQLIGLLGIIYCSISPFIVPCCLLYYIMMYIVWKYNLCFSMHNTYQDGGYMYGGALYSVWVGLLLHLLTMIGIFSLKRNTAQSVLIIIPLGVVLVFYRMIRKSFTRISRHGSTLQSIKRAEDSEEPEEISDDMASKYIHPSFLPIPDPLEDLSGVAKKSSAEAMDDFQEGKGDDLEKGIAKKNEEIHKQQPQNYFSVHDDNSKSKSADEWLDADNGTNAIDSPPTPEQK